MTRDDVHPRLVLVAARDSQIRTVLSALGWPTNAVGLSTTWCPRPWPDRDRTAPPRVVVAADLRPGRLADHADAVLTVRSRGHGLPLQVSMIGKSPGLLRRLAGRLAGRGLHVVGADAIGPFEPASS